MLQDSMVSVAQSQPLLVSGADPVTGLVMEAVGLKMALAALRRGITQQSVEAEVVGFSGEKIFLMPEHDVQADAGARVTPLEQSFAPALAARAAY